MAIIDLLADVTPAHLPWVSLYWVFSALLLVMLIAVVLTRFPKITLQQEEKTGGSGSYLTPVQTAICMAVLSGYLLLCECRAGYIYLHEYVSGRVSRSESANRRCTGGKLLLGTDDCRDAL